MIRRGCVKIGRSLALVLAVGWLGQGISGAADWPQWRGVKRDGHSAETGLLKKWPAGGPKLAKKIEGLGGGYSGVAVVGGKIYTMGDIDGACRVLAVGADGRKAWATEVGEAGGHQKYPGPRATPTVDGDRLYTLTQFGDLICLETKTGKLVWRKNLETDFQGAMMSGWRYSESVLVDGDKVVCTPGGAGGAVVALRKSDGSEIWRCKEFTDPAGYSSIVIMELGNARQYAQLTGESLAGIEAATGKLLWRADRAGKTAVITTPVFKDNLIFVTSSYNIGCNLFKVSSAGGRFSAEEVYASKDMMNHHGGVVLVGNHVYGTGNNELICMEMATGKVAWKDASVGKGSIACADGMLIVRGERGPVALVRANPSRYEELGRFDQPDRSAEKAWPHPVIADGKLYLRDQDVLLIYDLKR